MGETGVSIEGEIESKEVKIWRTEPLRKARSSKKH